MLEEIKKQLARINTNDSIQVDDILLLTDLFGEDVMNNAENIKKEIEDAISRIASLERIKGVNGLVLSEEATNFLLLSENVEDSDICTYYLDNEEEEISYVVRVVMMTLKDKAEVYVLNIIENNKVFEEEVL